MSKRVGLESHKLEYYTYTKDTRTHVHWFVCYTKCKSMAVGCAYNLGALVHK